MKTPLSKTASGLINTKHGEFGIDSFWNGIEEAIVLKKGDLQSKPDVLCRIQSECIDHFFMGTHCDCMDEVDNSLENIAKEQLGLLIYLKQEGKGQGLVAKIKGNDEDKRKYDIAAQIIQFYQIQSIILITNNKDKEKALRQNNIPTYSKSPFGSIIILGTKLKTVIRDIVDEKANPILVDRRKTRILIIGDLNIDNFLNIDNKSFGGSDVTPYEDKVGGTGYNAAIAFKNGGFSSILFGKIGSDNNGDKITKQLKIDNIISFIGFSEKPTGFCNLLYFEDKPRTIKYNGDNANEYDINDLKQALILADINKQDYVFITSYLFTAKKLSNGTIDKEYCKMFIELLIKTEAKVILDLVPHQLYKHISLDDLTYCINSNIFAIIGELPTFINFIYTTSQIMPFDPRPDLYKEIINKFNSKYIICRYGGNGNIDFETTYSLDGNDINYIGDTTKMPTGYDDLKPEERRGFGDRLAAKALQKLIDEEEKLRKRI